MNNKHEIIVKIENEEWKEALDKSFKKKVEEVKIDGFREGKVPRDVYEKKYGKESLYMDAIDIVLPTAFQKAIEESKLIPVVQPNVDVKSVDENAVELVFMITTKPEVKIKKYKGLKVEEVKVEVTDEEVEKEIEKIQQQYAEIVLKTGNIENGDTAVIDFEGFKDGVAFEGGKGENYPLEIGSRTFIPGFEEQLIGLKAADEKEIEVTFPADYPGEELKGQKVIFKVKVNEVKTKEIPDLNEEFYKDLEIDGVTNKEELFKVTKEELIDSKELAAENARVDNILGAVAKETEVELPEEMVTEEIHRMIHQFEERLKMQGASLEQYCQLTGTDHDKFHEQFKGEAEKVLSYRLMIEEIAELENIVITDEEAKAEATQMAEKYQMSEEELLKAFGSHDMIKYDLKMRRAIEVLKENN